MSAEELEQDIWSVCAYGEIDSLKSIVNRSVNSSVCVNQKDSYGSTPLIESCRLGNEAVVAYLLERKADVNACNLAQHTALHVAAGSGTIKALRLLIAKGASVNAQDSKGKTPLHWAMDNDHTQCANALVVNGADVSLKKDLSWVGAFKSRAEQNQEETNMGDCKENS